MSHVQAPPAHVVVAPKAPAAPKLQSLNVKKEEPKPKVDQNQHVQHTAPHSLVQHKAKTTQTVEQLERQWAEEAKFDPVEQADLTRFDVGVTYDDTLLQSSKPHDKLFGQLEDDSEINEEDIDEDAYALSKERTYEEEANKL